MRSKTSYFNPTLFKKNLSRFWPLWGGASLIGALFPLAFLTILIRENSFLHRISDPLEITNGYYLVVAYIVPTLSLLYAALCALAAWGWLYNPRSVGLYHSLPITRKGLFVTDFLSGLAMMLIPYAVTGALAVLVSAAVGGVEPVGLLVTVLSVLGESFFYFASATLIAFITGNPFAFAAFYFIFHFLAAAAEWLVSLLMTAFYFGVERSYEGVAEFLSPTLFLTRNLDVRAVSQQITTPEGWIENGNLESVTLVNGWLIAVYALAGVILLGCAWALYRRRRSECAGDVVAVGWMKPVFRYGVALCAAFTGGLVLYGLFFEGFQDTATASALPMVVCMVIAGVVGYYIASMLLSKSLRVFRGSWKGVLGTVLAAAALCFAVAADPFGVESWVPEAGELEQAGISLHNNNGYLDVTVTDEAAVQKILDLHRAVLSEKEILNDHGTELWQTGYSGYLNLSYWVNGRRVGRYYRLPYPETGEQTQLEYWQKAAALATDPTIQEANIFGELTRYDPEDITNIRVIHGYVGDVYNPATGEIHGVDLTPEQAKAVEDAVRRDIQAGHFGKTLFLTDEEERDRSVYYGTLQFDYSVTRRPGSRYYRSGSGTWSESFQISVYCTETVKALEGLLGGDCRLLTCAERNAMDNEEKGLPYGYDDPYSYDSSVVYPGDAYVYPGEMVDASTLH